MSAHASYRHTQWFTAMWLGLPLPALFVSVAALRDDRLRWTFGFLGWPRWDLSLQEIELVQCVRTSAWRGAGIKVLGKDKLFSVSIGGPALRLGLSGGRIVTLGTPEPERLAAFIEARRPPPR